MKKLSLSIFALFLFCTSLIGQVKEFKVSGAFQNQTFPDFVRHVESNSDIRFFFYMQDVESIHINHIFKDQVLSDCLLQILENTQLNFTIQNTQAFIYRGEAIQTLFREQNAGRDESAAVQKTDEQLSLERLHARQYELQNIGTPGSHRSGYATISGKIKVYNSNISVPGCNIYTKEDRRGASSDSKGSYSLRLPLGNHTIIYSSVGMETTQRQVNLYADGTLNMEMLTKVNLLDDVEILGNDKGKLNRVEMGMETIDMKSIKNLPKLLGEADLIKSTLTLPGVSTVGEGAAGFNVRGGKTDQNLILIDNTPIFGFKSICWQSPLFCRRS